MDIPMICRKDILTDKGCEGAADWQERGGMCEGATD